MLTKNEQAELAAAREALATIGRICEASGIKAANMSTVQRVTLLAREHGARGAMVAAQARMIDGESTMYTSEPLDLPVEQARTVSRLSGAARKRLSGVEA